MAFKARTTEQNAKIQRVRGMSRSLGNARLTSFGETGHGSERQDIRADIVGGLAHKTTVPVADVKGISGIHGASPELRSHFPTPESAFSSGAYDHAAHEIHTGSEISSDAPDSAWSALSHEIGHHVDTVSGTMLQDGRVRDHGESEAKAVNYQERHGPVAPRSAYDTTLSGNASYVKARSSGMMPGTPAAHHALGRQFGVA